MDGDLIHYFAHRSWLTKYHMGLLCILPCSDGNDHKPILWAERVKCRTYTEKVLTTISAHSSFYRVETPCFINTDSVLCWRSTSSHAECEPRMNGKEPLPNMGSLYRGNSPDFKAWVVAGPKNQLRDNCPICYYWRWWYKEGGGWGCRLYVPSVGKKSRCGPLWE